MQNRLPGLRVLVVEDNPILACDIDDALRESGVDVVGPALDLESGLALVSEDTLEDTLDGAILDIDIGGQPVWPIARRLKGCGVPFVFVSGDCALGLPSDFSDAVCLDKPAATEAILTSVAQIVKTA